MDKTLITVALIAAIPPTLVALLGLFRVRQAERAIQDVHLTINSRMTELLAASKGVSRSEGKAEGKLEERQEVAERKLM